MREVAKELVAAAVARGPRSTSSSGSPLPAAGHDDRGDDRRAARGSRALQGVVRRGGREPRPRLPRRLRRAAHAAPQRPAPQRDAPTTCACRSRSSASAARARISSPASCRPSLTRRSRLAHDEMIQMVVLLLVAGNETTNDADRQRGARARPRAPPVAPGRAPAAPIPPASTSRSRRCSAGARPCSSTPRPLSRAPTPSSMA